MRIVVTGGGGFLGSRICRYLADRGDQVIALARHHYPHLESIGVTSQIADIRDPDAVHRACQSADAVIHTAAIPGIWGPRKLFHDINVIGTRNVVDACRAHGIPKLVHTSSPSVVFGNSELLGVDESTPYPTKYLAHYPATKAQAERIVLAANSKTLSTVCLRPHLIWGPGDPHLIPRLIARAKSCHLRQVGLGKNLVDITYIDNAAWAHVLALNALSPTAPCAGRAYFISQGQPVILWDWIRQILAAHKLSLPKRPISFTTARRVGAVMEWLYHLTGSKREPPMTRFLAEQLAKSHYFDISAARREIGYEPIVSTGEGMHRLTVYRSSL